MITIGNGAYNGNYNRGLYYEFLEIIRGALCERNACAV